jgi:N-acylneuraminate cytidylyltransferase
MTRPIALVPMKGNSVRVPRKNLRLFCGRPLYHWIVQALAGARTVERVVVETDSDEIEGDVRANFPDVEILRRPRELQGDDVAMNLVLENAMRQLPGDLFLQSHSTNPLLTSATIDRSVDAFLSPGGHDSLFAVNVWRTRFFWEDGRPVNHNPDELIPTQNLPALLEENSNIYIFTRAGFAKRRHRIGTAPLLFPMEYTEAVDIDEIVHFEMAEALMERRLRRIAEGAGR